MSFIGPSAVYPDTFRAIEWRLSAFTLLIKLREHLVDNPKTVADLEVHLLTLARAAGIELPRTGRAFFARQGERYRVTRVAEIARSPLLNRFAHARE